MLVIPQAAQIQKKTRKSKWRMCPIANTLYTVDATEYVTAQIEATFHEGRANGER